MPAFLSHLAVERKVSASTQNQALSAILFLYRKVLKIELGWLDDLVHARRPARLPVVLTRSEVATILECLHDTPWLMASLLYGAGLRVLECARLRVKDIDLDRREILVRDGKGRKDRVTLLPDSLGKRRALSAGPLRPLAVYTHVRVTAGARSRNRAARARESIVRGRSEIHDSRLTRLNYNFKA